MNDVTIAILLTAVAGLSTGFGGLITFFSKKMNTKFLSFTLGISAGVMIYISFAELLTKSNAELMLIYGKKMGAIINALTFFAGIALVAVVDKLIPESETLRTTDGDNGKKVGLMRTGVVTALALGIHNFPEGMATFVSSLQSPVVALPIVAAIAIHNIPEGIAVSMPIFYATGSRRKAFLYSLLSGIAEPVGAIIGYLILMPFMNDTIKSIVFSAIAGIMVFISVDELLPAANEYGEYNLSVSGFVAGMLIMAISLIGFM